MPNGVCVVGGGGRIAFQAGGQCLICQRSLGFLPSRAGGTPTSTSGEREGGELSALGWGGAGFLSWGRADARSVCDPLGGSTPNIARGTSPPPPAPAMRLRLMCQGRAV